MRLYSSSQFVLWCLVLPLFFLTSCVVKDFELSSQVKDEGIILNVNVANSGLVDLSRTSSDRTDRSRIEDMNIVLVEDNVIKKIIYVNSESPVIPEQSEEDGLKNRLPVESGPLQYHVSKGSMVGIDQIFVVCNYWQIDSGTGEIIPDNGNLNNVFKEQGKTYTVDDLKALQQGTPRKPGIMTSTLFGEAEPDKDTGTDEHGGQKYTCELQRTTAMITVAIETGDANKLNAGVKITPRSICLHNVPVNCNIGSENTVTTDDRIWEEGLVQQVGWDPLVESNEK